LVLDIEYLFELFGYAIEGWRAIDYVELFGSAESSYAESCEGQWGISCAESNGGNSDATECFSELSMMSSKVLSLFILVLFVEWSVQVPWAACLRCGA
jgi:hypothetical protein